MLFMFYEDTSKPLKKTAHDVYVRTGATTKLSVTRGTVSALEKDSTKRYNFLVFTLSLICDLWERFVCYWFSSRLNELF
jgi:hypothetical protein